MKIYYGGAEQKGWREFLYSCGVRDMSLSFVGLLRRTKKPEQFKLSDEFPDDVNIFVDSGTYTLNKDDSRYTEEDVAAIATKYDMFVNANRERLEMTSSFDANQIEVFARETWNNRLKLELGEKYLPIWKPESTHDLRQYAHHERLGIQAGRSINTYMPQLNRLVMDSGIKLHGVAMTQIDAMRDVRWDSVGSTSWLSPSQYGDTILWTGSELKRFPKDYKGRGREGYRKWITDNGFDFMLITNDNSTELLRLSVWSWQQYVKYLNRRNQVTQMADYSDPENMDHDNNAVAHYNRPDRHRKLLPVLGIQYDEHTETNEDGEEIAVRTQRIRASQQSLMQCNTCMIQDRCPEMTPDASCAFDIPIDLSIPQAEDELWTTMTEIQGQRVMVMRMFEQANGSGYDPNVGPEIDRLMRIMNAKKKQNQSSFRQVTEINVPGNGSGFINELLGSKAADRLHPQIEQGESDNTVDAEIISDSEDND